MRRRRRGQKFSHTADENDGGRRLSGLADGQRGVSLAYWKPYAALLPYVSGYHRYVLRLPAGERRDDVFYPGWANIRFLLDAEPVSVRLGRRRFDRLPPAALFGPTSHAGYSSAGSGTMVGAGITPVGWARLIGGGADRHADRIGSLAAVLEEAAEALRAELQEGADPAELFDRFFLDLLAKRPPESPRVAELFTLLGDPAIRTSAELAARMEVSGAVLARLARANFGFTPKLLLRRTRFMRVLLRAHQVERGHWHDLLFDAGYHDQSHFVRDCHLFLDMPLSHYMALAKPTAEASLRLRTQILGAPVQSLHQAQAPPPCTKVPL